jgi:hypothetical protein
MKAGHHISRRFNVGAAVSEAGEYLMMMMMMMMMCISSVCFVTPIMSKFWEYFVVFYIYAKRLGTHSNY